MSVATTPRRLITYGCLGIVTAPLWVPFAFVGYVGAKMTRFAFRHATPVAIALGIAGVATYAGCHHRDAIGTAVSTAIERIAHEDAPAISQPVAPATGLERIVTTAPPAPAVTSAPRAPPPSARATLPFLDEPGVAYYYVKPGDTLSRISAVVTGDPGQYRMIARENRIPDPNDVTVGSLLRIPERLCRTGVPGLYDRVPALNSLTLPAGVTITEMFGPKARDVIALNRSLGLAYEDAFPYPRGERVVWFP